jgi:hypothetical protein
MTDYTDLIARLRAPVPTVYDCKDAADALAAQAARIADLRKEADMMHSEYKTARASIDDLKAALEAQARRIAELEVPLCVGETTIRLLAKEGACDWTDGRALVAADELFRQDPYARIAELEAENEELKKAISKPWMGSARAAYLGETE